ncbi:MAG: Maf family protein [Kurthia sp.]|nr:Maf family protein [Candidatus Kurthia equi]
MGNLFYTTASKKLLFSQRGQVENVYNLTMRIKKLKMHKENENSNWQRNQRLFLKQNGFKLKQGQILKFANMPFLCFGEDIIQLNYDEINRKKNMKYIDRNWCKIVIIPQFITEFSILSKLLETCVRFCSFSYEILKKYMQTKEPFHCKVGYNILGEGQQFVDEKNRSTYNKKGLSILAMEKLRNRVKHLSTVKEVDVSWRLTRQSLFVM